ARLRRHLELRPPELLDLELVGVGALLRPLRLEFHVRGAEVRRLRQRELQVEPADRAHGGPALRDLVAARVVDRVGELRDRARRPGEAAFFARSARAQPALARPPLAWLVHLASVDPVPAPPRGRARLAPRAVVAPVAAVLGDERDVIAAPRDQVVRA